MLDITATPTSSGRWSTGRSAGSRSGKTPRLRVLGILPEATDPAAIIGAFCDRYPNTNTNDHYRRLLTDLFRTTGRRHPADLTEQDLIVWCSGPGKQMANNSIRSRIALARTFLGWCLRHAYVAVNPMDEAAGPDGPLRRYRRTYGKVQAKNPGRWLTKKEAFGTLLASCADDGLPGLRDELVLRLGLLGMRASEICRLRVGDLSLEGERTHLTWTGKGYKPRSAAAGSAFTTALRRWLDAYTEGIGQVPAPEAPLICPQVVTRWTHLTGVLWGVPLRNRNSVWRYVTARAQKAGLGHVAPHDLRRSAAGILHRSKDHLGRHDFDLLDIQKVLGHSDPATTMRCYLDPMDTEVIDRAADFLD